MVYKARTRDGEEKLSVSFSTCLQGVAVCFTIIGGLIGALWMQTMERLACERENTTLEKSVTDRDRAIDRLEDWKERQEQDTRDRTRRVR